MQTTTLHPSRLPRFIDREPLRSRAELSPMRALAHPLGNSSAAHDFLVPNPRPDLTADPHTLRMIEAG